ncbi:hypothetical protein MCEMSE15_02038 [Fimbriimonadaceae bacterium]
MNYPPLVPSPRDEAQFAAILNASELLVKKQFVRLLGKKLRILERGKVVLTVEQEGLMIKAPIRVFLDEAQTQPVLGAFTPPQEIGYQPHDIVDLMSNQKIGVIHKVGNDDFRIYDAWGREIGELSEDSLLLSLIRKVLFNLIPQKYDLKIAGKKVARYSQNWNPLTYRLTVRYLVPASQFDRRLGLAAAVMLACLEGRETSVG